MITSAPLSSCPVMCLSFSCLHSLLCPIFIHRPSTWLLCLVSTILLLCFSSFPIPFFLLSDKAPGQRECDSSIDNINKCIRDIEQASLAAVSQNLASRDDISLEVNDRQKMTRHFPPTTTCMLLCLHLFVLIWLFYLHRSLFFCLVLCRFYCQIVFCPSSLCGASCVSLINSGCAIGVFN